MFARTFFCTALIALTAVFCVAQRSLLSPNDPAADASIASISGSVRTADDKPAKDARVELVNLTSGQVVAAGYTTLGGTFDFSNIPNGSYEVSVVSGLDEARERIELRGLGATVNLRFPRPASAEAGNSNSVSVADMQVPGKARDALKKARTALSKQQVEDASRYVEQALAIHPEYSEALTMRGILNLDAGKIDAACEDFDHAIKADNGNSTAYFALGAAYNMTSRFDDALRTIDRGIALAPNSWQAYFEMGKAFLGKGSYDAAVRQLNKAQDMGPKNYPLIHLVKAHALLGLKNYAEAMAELQWYIERAPQGDRNSAQARQMLDKVRAFAATPVGK